MVICWSQGNRFVSEGWPKLKLNRSGTAIFLWKWIEITEFIYIVSLSLSQVDAKSNISKKRWHVMQDFYKLLPAKKKRISKTKSSVDGLLLESRNRGECDSSLVAWMHGSNKVRGTVAINLKKRMMPAANWRYIWDTTVFCICTLLWVR